MHKLTFLATLTLGGLLALGGCHMNISEGGSGWDDEWDDDWDDGGGICGGGTSGGGDWGDSCVVDSDCDEGLTCDEQAGECVPAPCTPQPCTTDDDCGDGFTCDEDASECVPTGVCTVDEDCDEGYVCDVEQSTCVPYEPPPPTCADQQTETECIDFGGCEPVYAGVDCSCGPDCECTGGEPGCVCASFEFFKCEDADTP